MDESTDSLFASSRMSTPPSSTDETDDKEEERILKLLKEQYQKDNVSNKQLKEGLKEFEGLSGNAKLKKLDELVKRSQLFSSIIADTLLDSSLTKQEEVEEPAKADPPKKKRKVARKSKRLTQSTLTDLLGSKKKNAANSDKLDEQKKAVMDASSGAKQSHQPKMITGCTLKDYQITGMEWLITLYQNGLNGILADEMGLGKTLQSISMLAFLYEQGITGPFLICCPLSTVSNWVNEFHRFAPDFDVLAYVGTKDKRAKLRRRLSKANVVVASYEMCIKDFNYLAPKEWKYLVVDEGHRLKNANCLLIRQLKRLRTSNRLLLTGTPLQNNLDELWSLLNFILPEIFHDVEMFEEWFDFTPFEDLKEDGEEAHQFNEIITLEIQKTLVENLHTILKPFLLRRLKKDVIRGLPPKREYIIYSKLSARQEALYKAILSKNFSDHLYKESFKDYLRLNKLNPGKTDSQLEKYVDSQLHGDQAVSDPKLDEHWKFVRKNVAAKKMQNVMMQLRLVCDSPYLFFFPWNDDTSLSEELVQNSCKLEILGQLVPKLISQNHRILIFSQFSSMLDVLQEYVTELLGLNCCRIDGSTSQADRQEQIELFNEKDSDTDVFLLSTRAGGLGINLATADTVVLFDSDWNPQVDLQAMDRVHRIGQTKPVVVYRLVCANTIEEFLLAKADSKRRLERLVIQLGDFHSLLQSGAKTVSFGAKAQSKGKAQSNEELLGNLRKFLGSKEVKTKEIDDNHLTRAELKEVMDRSPEAYKQDSAKEGEKRSHISLFETVSASV